MHHRRVASLHASGQLQHAGSNKHRLKSAISNNTRPYPPTLSPTKPRRYQFRPVRASLVTTEHKEDNRHRVDWAISGHVRPGDNQMGRNPETYLRLQRSLRLGARELTKEKKMPGDTFEERRGFKRRLKRGTTSNNRLRLGDRVRHGVRGKGRTPAETREREA